MVGVGGGSFALETSPALKKARVVQAPLSAAFPRDEEDDLDSLPDSAQQLIAQVSLRLHGTAHAPKTNSHLAPTVYFSRKGAQTFALPCPLIFQEFCMNLRCSLQFPLLS